MHIYIYIHIAEAAINFDEVVVGSVTLKRSGNEVCDVLM